MLQPWQMYSFVVNSCNVQGLMAYTYLMAPVFTFKHEPRFDTVRESLILLTY